MINDLQEALTVLYDISHNYAYKIGNDNLVDKVFDSYALIQEFINKHKETENEKIENKRRIYKRDRK